MASAARQARGGKLSNCKVLPERKRERERERKREREREREKERERERGRERTAGQFIQGDVAVGSRQHLSLSK
jgi:hypothetical protein